MKREALQVDPSSLGARRRVDISELKSKFREAEISHELALDYDGTHYSDDKSLFRNIITEYNLGSGAYGVYDPKHSMKVKEELASKLQYKEKDLEELGHNVFGVSFGINVNRILQEAKKLYSGDIWKFFAIIYIAETMIHEAAHATYGASEPEAEREAAAFRSWALEETRAKKILSALNIKDVDLIQDLEKGLN